MKKAKSKYVPSSRSAWLKLKKDYIPGMGDSGDYAIIAASYERYRNNII